MRAIRIAMAAMLVCCATEALAQQASTGLGGFYGGIVQAPETFTEFPAGNDTTIISSTIPFSASASGSTAYSSAGLSIAADTANGNVGLHGSANAAVSGNGPFATEGAAESQFDLYAYDAFQIGGPAGAPEQFQYTLTLNGSTQTSTEGDPLASAAYGALQLFGDSNWTEPGAVTPFATCIDSIETNLNPCGLLGSVYLNQGAPSGGTQIGVLTLIGGSTIQLGEMLWARAMASNATSASASLDASDTGFFTLTPITEGASFTTASGLSYAQSPDVVGSVPEPATWAMMLLGFGAIGFAMRRKAKQRPNSSPQFA